MSLQSLVGKTEEQKFYNKLYLFKIHIETKYARMKGRERSGRKFGHVRETEIYDKISQ